MPRGRAPYNPRRGDPLSLREMEVLTTLLHFRGKYVPQKEIARITGISMYAVVKRIVPSLKVKLRYHRVSTLTSVGVTVNCHYIPPNLKRKGLPNVSASISQVAPRRCSSCGHLLTA